MIPTVTVPAVNPAPAGTQSSNPAPSTAPSTSAPVQTAKTDIPSNQTVSQPSEAQASADDARPNVQAPGDREAARQSKARQEAVEAAKQRLIAQVGADRVDEVVDGKGNVDYKRVAEIRQERYAEQREEDEDDKVEFSSEPLYPAVFVDVTI